MTSFRTKLYENVLSQLYMTPIGYRIYTTYRNDFAMGGCISDGGLNVNEIREIPFKNHKSFMIPLIIVI